MNDDIDCRLEATLIVLRALILSIPNLQRQYPKWSRSSLGSLFPIPEDFKAFLLRVSADAAKANETPDEKDRVYGRLKSVGEQERDPRKITTLIDIVEEYLTGGKLGGDGNTLLYPSRVIETSEQPSPISLETNSSANISEPRRSEYTRLEIGGYGSQSATSNPDNSSLVQVFFATDRMLTHSDEFEPIYDQQRSVRGKLHYGTCSISIPKLHKLGKLETPSILRLEFRPNPEKHIMLQKIENLEEDVFFKRVARFVAASAAKEAFIFIHGYKVSFEDAARRTGQIAFDLNFVGAPVLYSWPSYGKLADYTRDENNIIWSTPHFQRFLELMSQRSGAERIHIIAHSMGNRAVCDALKALSNDPSTKLKFNHLLLAAADIDADTFRELATSLQRISGHITLYESSNDKALHASKEIHGNPRAGEPLLLIPGIDTIDASAIDTDFLGHSYFSDNWPLLSDIHSILRKDEPPSMRFGLREMDCSEGKYYVFRA